MAKLYRRKAAGNWHADYTGSDGDRVQKSTGTSNKTAAQKILAKWQLDATSQRHGLTSAPKQSLLALLDNYLEYIGDDSDEHVERVKQRVTRILDATGAEQPNDLDRVQVEVCVKKFTTLGRKTKTKIISKRSQAHYLTAIKGYTRWLTELKHVYLRDPLAGLKKPNFTAERVLVRRFLLPSEWPWLAQTKHALLYETAIQTGLRSSELRAVKPVHLKRDHVLLPASETKNKRVAKQYIGPKLGARLARALPFDMPPRDAVADMLREDLQAARCLYVAAGNDDANSCSPTTPAARHSISTHSDTLAELGLRSREPTPKLFKQSCVTAPSH